MKKFFLGVVVGGILSPIIISGAVLAYFKYVSMTRPQDSLRTPVLPVTNADYDWTMKTVAGDDVPFADFKGKVVFLTFFKPTCSSCKSELPHLQALYDEIENDDIEFALVSVDGQTEEEWLTFMQEHDVSFPIYVAEEGRPAVFRTGTVPTTFILDTEGKIAARYQGAAAWNDESSVNYLRGLALSGAAPTGE